MLEQLNIPASTRGGRYYVYLLCYPNEKVFYVGKGTGRRVDAHERICRLILKKNKMTLLSHKDKVMIEIWDTGGEVLKKIVFRTDDEQEAFRIESMIIDHFGLERLTNETYGHYHTKKKHKRTV